MDREIAHDVPAEASDTKILLLAAIRRLGGLSSGSVEALAAHAKSVTLRTGDPLFRPDESGDPFYVVHEGLLHARPQEATGDAPAARVLGPGEALDLLQLLSGAGGPLRVEAVRPTTVVRISGSELDRLAAGREDVREARDRAHRRQLLCRLHPLLGTLDAALLDEIEAVAEWVHRARGELLYEQDDPSDGLCFVISGRLRAIRHEKDGSERVLVEAGRGDLLGETEFFTGESRGSRAEAIRDTVLVRFSDAAFETLLARRPGLLRAVTRSIAARAQLPPLGGKRSGRVGTIAVMSSSPSARIDQFIERLARQLATHGPTLRLSSEGVDRAMDEPGISHAWEGSMESRRLLAWLESREELTRFVLYQADATVTPWTRRCLRQADRVLLVAHAADDPQPGEVESGLLLLEGRLAEAHQALVLVHPDGGCLPTGTRRWLEPRPFLEEHHHVRWDGEADFARLARVLAGRSVGVVLGGGGARGFAHIGVLRALREAGVPIDRIGGTSMGASLAAQWALGWSAEEIEAMNRRVWIEIQPHKRFTIPVVSLVASRQAAECGRMMYGETDIEDLWTPFFCVSSNLSTAQMVVHRNGPLIRAVTASASLPGFAEPVVDGSHLLVDGALLNNLPTDVMRALGSGPIVASEVSVEEDASFLADRVPSVWELLRGRARFPSLMELVMRSTLLHSTSREKAAMRSADLCLRPPVDTFSLMDFPRLGELVEVGYRYAAGELERLAAGGAPAGLLLGSSRLADPFPQNEPVPERSDGVGVS